MQRARLMLIKPIVHGKALLKVILSKEYMLMLILRDM